MCDNEIVSQSNDETSELHSIGRTARLSEQLHFDALLFKVMRTLVSPELV